MNRLLQGDVGSGKTLVALMSMLIAADNGFQSCLMAPTEILASQHHETISKFLQGSDVKIALLTGSTKTKDRKIMHEALETGQLNIIVGTHALIEDTVKFANLGLAVIDEQHRFGVEQRSKLWKKNAQPPHILVMTATPIPRTLAMTLYGDLTISVIDELPPGRKPIQTYHYYENKRQALNGFIRKQLNEGRQIYVVYPMIEESEKSDLQNVTEGLEYFRETFPDIKVGMVHGKLKSAEKDYQMQQFSGGISKILVATTVIEVGVNVPNASVMIIENAERFGLSQLHQLRGRVGRGASQSFCILLTGFKLASDTRKRLEILTKTNDGFEISEADLQLRGPGDLEGTQQSGMPFELKIADLARDGKMLQIARNYAMEILNEDPKLEEEKNIILSDRLKKLNKRTVNWGVIS
jgi:ATP-dependent DNA helicase RecG